MPYKVVKTLNSKIVIVFGSSLNDASEPIVSFLSFSSVSICVICGLAIDVRVNQPEAVSLKIPAVLT
jgi:hypothetical protein